MTSLKITALSLVAGAALLGSVTSGVFAAPKTAAPKAAAMVGVHRAVLITGTVTSATATSLTITRANGKTITIEIAPSTRYVVSGHVADATAAAPTLATNQKVRIRAQRQARSTFVARTIWSGTLPKASGVAGTISNATGTSFTLTAKSGKSVTVRLTAATTYVLNGKKVAGLSALPASRRVRVFGPKAADGSITARSIRSGVASRVRDIAGTVASTGTSSLTVTTKAGKTLTLQITTATRYLVNGKQATTAPTFATGTRVLAIGVRQSAGVFSARAISTGTAAARIFQIRARGTISSATGTAVIVTLKSGKTVTFQITSGTRYVVSGKVAATAPALTTNEPVLVIGRAKAGRLVALAIRIS